MNQTLLLAFVAVGLGGGCTLAPKYCQPTAPVDSRWPSGAAYQRVRTNSPLATDLRWREFFVDETLRELIGAALTNNLNLRLALQNVERARAYYGIQRAALLPAIDGNAKGSRYRLPGDLSSSGHSQINPQYDVNLGVAAWEIDFFGRIRSLKDESLEQYLATKQARRSAQISLIASIANAYLAVAADRESVKLAQTTLQTQQGTYDLVKRRYGLGLVPELDLRRAQTQVDAARGDIARYTQLVAEDENALRLLVGSALNNEVLPDELDALKPPQDVAAGLPSETLLRRPDILQAEHQLKAANADIGAARAAFFPRVSLTAAAGTSSSELSGLFKSGSGAWSYAPQVVMPIFDARTWSAHRAAKAQRDIAVTQYQLAIQSAFREVADALATRGTVDQQLAAQESYVNAVEATYDLSRSRYAKGIDSYLSVLDAQRSLYSAQQALVSLRLAKLTSQVRLYAVLGGGTEPESDPDHNRL